LVIVKQDSKIHLRVIGSGYSTSWCYS